MGLRLGYTKGSQSNLLDDMWVLTRECLRVDKLDCMLETDLVELLGDWLAV